MTVKDLPIIRETNNNSHRAHTEWVNTSDIIPNPLNPRKDDAVKSDELQQVIKKRGWEMPITAYKKGSMYVVLSGHRRLYAAKQAKIKQIPVFVVEAPKTHQEEVERIASAQLAQEDWTALEWAKFTYERWLAWGRPTVNSFAQELRLPRKTMESYIRVLDYFPMYEIESGLNQKKLSISVLYDLVLWIRKVKETHPLLEEALTEDMIRRVSLEKLMNKKFSREAMRKKDFLSKVSDEDLKLLFTEKDMNLEELMVKYEYDVKERTFHAQLVSMGFARKSVKNINPKNAEEAKKAYDVLKEIEESLKNQLGHLQRKYPSVETRNDLFDWEKK